MQTESIREAVSQEMDRLIAELADLMDQQVRAAQAWRDVDAKVNTVQKQTKALQDMLNALDLFPEQGGN